MEKNDFFKLRISETEKSELKKIAESRGLSCSELIRNLIKATIASSSMLSMELSDDKQSG